MNSTPVKIWLTIVLAGLAVYGGWTFYRIWNRFQQSEQPGHAISIQRGDGHAISDIADVGEKQILPLENMELIGVNGQPFDIDERLLGHVWIAKLFFTTCPTMCHEMSTKMRVLQDKDEFKELRLLSVSCDPDTDTPAALRAYARRYGADVRRWHFVVGRLEEVTVLGNEVFGLAVNRRSHSGRIVVVDREGKRHGAYDLTNPQHWQPLQDKLRELLANEDS